MATYDLTKKSKASTGTRVVVDDIDPKIDIRLSTLEKKIDRILKTRSSTTKMRLANVEQKIDILLDKLLKKND